MNLLTCRVWRVGLFLFLGVFIIHMSLDWMSQWWYRYVS